MFCIVKYDNFSNDYTFEIKHIGSDLEEAIKNADEIIKTELDLAIVSAISDNDFVDPNKYKIKNDLTKPIHKYIIDKHINLNKIVYQRFLELDNWIMCIFIIEK
jgi:hypothetical protein